MDRQEDRRTRRHKDIKIIGQIEKETGGQEDRRIEQ
jgi:hypothetical protein